MKLHEAVASSSHKEVLHSLNKWKENGLFWRQLKFDRKKINISSEYGCTYLYSHHLGFWGRRVSSRAACTYLTQVLNHGLWFFLIRPYLKCQATFEFRLLSYLSLFSVPMIQLMTYHLTDRCLCFWAKSLALICLFETICSLAFNSLCSLGCLPFCSDLPVSASWVLWDYKAYATTTSLPLNLGSSCLNLPECWSYRLI